MVLFCGVGSAPLLGPFLLLCWASFVVLVILCGGSFLLCCGFIVVLEGLCGGVVVLFFYVVAP